ncbi:hypothetical protein BFX13_04625 [Vibrio cholerae]|nr:hypothetical protein BFX13_04625 [Vibrio cholerae]
MEKRDEILQPFGHDLKLTKKPHEAAFGEINLFRQYWLYWLNGLKPAFEQQNQVIP